MQKFDYIKLNSDDTNRFNGSFAYQFSTKDSVSGKDKTFRLGALAVPLPDAFPRLCFPDNNVLSNKLINRVGRRVLNILRAQTEEAAAAHPSLICRTIPDEADLLSCWVLIDILSILKSLEPLRPPETNMSIVDVMGRLEAAKSQRFGSTYIMKVLMRFQNSTALLCAI